MITKISKVEMDVLKEAGNIGSASASRALSKLTNRPVKVETLKLEVMDIYDIPSLVGGPTIVSVGTLFEIVGELKGSLLLLSSKKTILGLVDILGEKELGTTEFLKDMDKDAIKEVGNILVGAYITALAEVSGLNILESVPKLEINNVPSMLKDVIDEYDHKEKNVLMIETQLRIKKEDFVEDIVLILGHKEFGKLFHAMAKGRE